MYAIVDIQGQQFKVSAKQKVFVHLLDAEEGSNIDFDKVLLIDNDKDVVVGNPVIAGALVSATVVKHCKGDKVKVFKKKRKKGYRVLKGHRQSMSEILIDQIVEKGGVKRETKARAKKTAVKAKAADAAAEPKKVARTRKPKAEVAEEATEAKPKRAPRKKKTEDSE